MVNVAEKSNTRYDTIEEINLFVYPNMYITVVILLVMSVSNATAERSFSAMRRHGDKNKTLDAERTSTSSVV